ncbi:MAG: enoyl-CoA hydratase/isomerase family protein [Rhodocyclaceae bacterium]|nr:enoyl-CoA hydratase/isomerase family protein [Rhodocyclaceae bacterium]
MSETILTEIDRGVGIITLNRAERHNAFDDVLIQDLSTALVQMDTDSDVRVVVLSSTGKSFCAGADLNWMKRAAGYNAEETQRDALGLAGMLRMLNEMKKPTVARVQGPAYGGGVGLVAACDISIATFDAQFALTEVKLGIIPAVISPYVIAAIGERKARRYMMTAERFSAAEAYRIGLVHEIVPGEAELDEAVGEIVDDLLANGPHALGECKALIKAVANRPISQEVVIDTAQRIARVRASDEGREGMAAFLEKRKPNWVPKT